MSALLIFGVASGFSSSSSSSFLQQQWRPKACIQNKNTTPPINPNFNLPPKWSLPLNHNYSFTPTQDSHHLLHSSTGKLGIEYGREMKNLKHLLSGMAKVDALESLNMIDAIQRLGIQHCFKHEIQAILQSQYTIIKTHSFRSQTSLYQLALRFRLLRQHGYFVSTDVFERFMDKEGKLEKECNGNIKCIMSLYEASQLCLPEEEELERIGNMSRHMLETCIRNNNVDNHLAKHVANSLAYPLHKSWGKLWATNYLVFDDNYHQYAANNKWIYVFQQMAKLELCRVQSLYRQEMIHLSKWWIRTELSKELCFARDQPLKWHICSLAFLSDPKFSQERIDLTKSISFIYLIDDIYDLYGSLQQLQLFTKAIQRWDLAATDNLAHPMKICYTKLYETTNEISHKFYRKHGWSPLDNLKKSWTTLCDAFLVEAEWFASGHSPSAEEYLENGIISSGVHVVLVHILFLLGQQINDQTLQLLNSNPPIVSSTASILRLADDLGSAQDENQEGYDGSYIEYYMKENPEISLDNARQRVIHMISEAWKRLNKESLSPNLFPAEFIEASQNIARFVPLLYGYDGNQNLPTLEKLAESVIYGSVQIQGDVDLANKYRGH